jgi:succinate dehydrogenase / fumarate reductase cytochrome b subunit
MSNIFSSSIGKKLIMSISGLFLLVFLLLHLSINLTMLISHETYNAACRFMDTNIFIQIMVPVLALGFAIHILYSIIITLKNQKARPVKYKSTNKSKASSWAARNMFILGFIVLGFIVLHLTQFWYKMQFQHFIGKHSHTDPYTLVSDLFRMPVYAIIYIVWIWILWLHLCHGFWSVFQTIGFNNQKWIIRWQNIAKIYATIVAVGFSIIPLYFLLGIA